MKTAEQIAQQVIEHFDADNQTPEGERVGFGILADEDLVTWMIDAIEADRKRRAVVTPGHSADDIADEAAGSLGIDYESYSPNREQVFAMCYEAASLAIDAVRAADRAQRRIPFDTLDHMLNAWDSYDGDVSGFMEAWLDHFNKGTDVPDWAKA